MHNLPIKFNSKIIYPAPYHYNSLSSSLTNYKPQKHTLNRMNTKYGQSNSTLQSLFRIDWGKSLDFRSYSEKSLDFTTMIASHTNNLHIISEIKTIRLDPIHSPNFFLGTTINLISTLYGIQQILGSSPIQFVTLSILGPNSHRWRHQCHEYNLPMTINLTSILHYIQPT